MTVKSSEVLEFVFLKSILLGMENVFYPCGSNRSVFSIKHLLVSCLKVMNRRMKRNGALTLFSSTSLLRLYDITFYRMEYGLNGSLATTTSL